MKSKKYIYMLASVLALCGLISCNDSYETYPVDQYTDDYVFSTVDSTGKKAIQFLNYIYNDIPSGHNRVGGDYLDDASGDALSSSSSTTDVYKLLTGSYTASNVVSSDMIWGSCYTCIRKCNILINGIDRVPFNIKYTDALGDVRPLNVTMKAEAKFIRSYMYFLLLERYGGVPIVGDKVFDISSDVELPRNSFKQCVDYIVGQMDSIQDLLRSLPIADASNYGHVVTKQACMALKSRVLLYAASPLFNGNTLEKGDSLVGYIDYDASRWKLAVDAARDIITGYGDEGSNILGLDPSFKNIFLNFYGGVDKEVIFSRQNGNGSTVERNNGPLGFSGTNLGYGRTCPTQNLVDAFPMKDGKSITDATSAYKYDEQHPYNNRDPRLNYTVLYNGSPWLGTTLQTYQGGNNNPSGGDYSQTGYFMRKFMGNFENVAEYSDHLYNWVIFRYAEVLLNFAEAENEYLSSPSDEVYQALIALRKRAGIDAGDNGLYGLKAGMTKDEMREVIHNERRIELAFEEHHYFDIRRWREAESIFATPVTGMQIIPSSSGYIYQEQNLVNVTFTNKMYLYPIPYSEVIKNKNMVQNPNWK